MASCTARGGECWRALLSAIEQKVRRAFSASASVMALPLAELKLHPTLQRSVGVGVDQTGQKSRASAVSSVVEQRSGAQGERLERGSTPQARREHGCGVRVQSVASKHEPCERCTMAQRVRDRADAHLRQRTHPKSIHARKPAAQAGCIGSGITWQKR